MCSCSGSCNCNSTTIPRGPIGPTGATGAASTVPGPQGPPGGNGLPGSNGLNAFTTLTAAFTQPAFNSTVDILVVNNSWAVIDQIIYIPTGGFYRVASKTDLTTIEVIKLDWTIPEVTFVEPAFSVGSNGTLVTPSGTIGAEGVIRKILDETSTDAKKQTTGATINNHLWNINDLITNQDTVTFDFIIAPFSGNGSFDDVRITVGTTLVSRFRFTEDATKAAQIKFDVDPTDVPAGYTSSTDPLLSEDINLIKGSAKITRRSDFTVTYDITYYMYNYFVQQPFSTGTTTRMLQKVFHTYGSTSVPQISLSGLDFSFLVDPKFMAGGATFGTDIQIYNAIKLNSIL